jgi:hypothetical protein
MYSIVLATAACSFDRSPIVRPEQATSGTNASPESGSGEPQNSGPDAGRAHVGDGDDGLDHDAAMDDAGSAGQAPPDEDAGPPPPMPLQCGSVFCPLAQAPSEACCTTQSDVDAHQGRGADLCGLDLHALGDASYAKGCWQRDQLGFIDARCPNRPAANGGQEQPGCCADDGMCGTEDPAHPLGCHHAPGSELRPCGMSMPTMQCDPTGSYGVRITVDTAWDGRDSALAALTDDGRGSIQLYYMAEVASVDDGSNAVKGVGRVCGIKLPQFYSTTLCESYQPVFPDSIWESSKLQNPPLDGHYECGTQGCVLSLGPSTFLHGIRLDNSEAQWPTAQQTRSLRCRNQPNMSCFPDDDDDGYPGLTVTLVTMGKAPPSNGCQDRGYSYRAAPLSGSPAAIFDGVRRTDRIQLGVRARVGVSVRFGDDCTTGMGSAIAQYVNSRATGCVVQEGTFDFLGDRFPAGKNEACTSTEANFIDQSMPEYQVLSAGQAPSETSSRKNVMPSPGPTVSVVRFGSAGMSVTCDMVRQAQYD